jgi:hypothetical protein
VLPASYGGEYSVRKIVEAEKKWVETLDENEEKEE